jgi:hypothetical protein
MNYSITGGVTGIFYVGYKNTSVNILFISHFTHCLFLLLIFPPFLFPFCFGFAMVELYPGPVHARWALYHPQMKVSVF